MRSAFFMLFLITLSTTASFADEKNVSAGIELEAAVKAYTDSKALGHKADTFLHARRAYRLARQLYLNAPSKLAPFAHHYAVAAAIYREPIALSLFEQTLDLLVVAHGRKAQELALPLVDAADEALTRSEPEMAYAWYDKARDLMERNQPNGSIELARTYMGLATMYSEAGEHDRAQTNAENSIALLKQHQDQASPITAANLYFRLGQIKRVSGNNEAALVAYITSLDLFLAENPRERAVLTIHKKLVEINHKLGRTDETVFHCIEAEKWENQRNMGIWWPIYDPAGRLAQHDKPKAGQILAGYSKGSDCKLHDIKIYKTVGITPEEAQLLLSQAYFTPRLRGGTLADDQQVEQHNIDVYDP